MQWKEVREMLNDWKMEAKGNTLELRIYDTVEKDSFWQKSETSAKHIAEMLEQHADAKEIKIYINSLGGSCMEGIAIYNQLKRHAAKKTVYIDGFACSIASVIAMAGDKIIMPKNTCMMIHTAWVFAMGNSKDLRKAADDLEVINNAAIQAYLDRAGEKLSKEKLVEMLDAETYLAAAQCIEYGLADAHSETDDADTTDDGPKQKLTADAAAQQAVEEEMKRRYEKCMAVINKFF